MTNTLTRSFYLHEFTKSAGITIKPTAEQYYCIKILCENLLQPIRNRFGEVQITSGLRNWESYNRLIKKGFPASVTSDHFGWSRVNPTGTGAADFWCPQSSSLLGIFHWCIINLNNKFRQVIYYPDMGVIHISNAFKCIFTMEDNIQDNRKVMIKHSNSGFEPYVIPLLCNN